jgi:23S rRNA (adenine2503-C2)-methyltransferase
MEGLSLPHMKRRDIRLLSQVELKDAVVALGEKPFRAKQLEEWIWTKSAASF